LAGTQAQRALRTTHELTSRTTKHGREKAVALYRQRLAENPELVEAARRELAGKDLACWCQPSELCHADVLLEVANSGTTP
jgi:hypothetical protein